MLREHLRHPRIQAMDKPRPSALPSFLYFFLHQVGCRIVQFIARMWGVLTFLGIISSRRCPLTELPTEMIEEILKHVDWQTLLRTRASCTRLNMVSRSLPVWRGQYARYMVANPTSAPLDTLMDSYSPSELEEVVLQRSAVEQGWLAKVEHPVSMTSIPHAEANRATFHIVEGGRWFLSSIQGSVTVYDLDNPNIPGKLIIPKYARTPTLGRATTDLSVDVLADTSTLTFNIAIEQGSPGGEDGPPWCTRFWQVTAHGRGTGAELRAIHLTSFTTPSPFWGVAACLMGQYYARSISSFGSGSFHEIYTWEETNLHEHRKAVIRSAPVDVIRILPNGKLLGFDRTEIRIYDIPPFETVPVCAHNRSSLATPLYSVLLPGNRLASNNISSIVIQPLETYSLIACTNAGILLVTLSLTTSHICVLFKLPDEPSLAADTHLSEVRMGWRRAYIQYYDDALTVSYNAWQHTVQPTTVPAEICAFRRVMIPSEGYQSMMDESSGRVVMAASQSSLTIYYYSLYDVNK